MERMSLRELERLADAARQQRSEHLFAHISGWLARLRGAGRPAADLRDTHHGLAPEQHSRAAV